ncbi:MAG: exodeoxyribonuclease III [Thermoanaerobaculales bacterium]|nr:exodeoxyribonuclease III [Thermoanaerobaculales bacterium]
MTNNKKSLKLISWNVNGLRACARKGFLDWLREAKPDILGLQEVRALPEQLDAEVLKPDGYETWLHPAEKKGYSGVGLYSVTKPRSVILGGLEEERFNSEGRLIIADYDDFLFYTGYFPNGGNTLARVPYKLAFSEAVLQHAEEQRKQGRSIVICGDVNTAHEEIDLANPKTNQKNTGFLPEERAWVSRFLDHGYVDIFRERHPGESGHYTWWSNRPGVRARNVGWRIDYFMISPDLRERVVDVRHHPDVMGSDHCPIEMVLALD